MTRVVSALVLAPIVLVAVHLGAPASDGLLLATAAILAWEWGRVCGRRRGLGPAEVCLIAACVAALGVGTLYGARPAAVVAVLGAIAAALAAALDRRAGAGTGDGEPGVALAPWFGFGALYVALPLLALQWLREPLADHLGDPAGQGDLSGALRIYWLIGLVWATDVGAFFVGRSLRGPKLWPRVSPNKTWSGMVGGLAAAGLVGAGFSAALLPAALWPLVVLSAILSFVAQAGDFFESAVKRRFGAKDSSGLIPGHGGLLDRVDGLLAATLALAFLAWLGKAPF